MIAAVVIACGVAAAWALFTRQVRRPCSGLVTAPTVTVLEWRYGSRNPIVDLRDRSGRVVYSGPVHIRL